MDFRALVRATEAAGLHRPALVLHEGHLSQNLAAIRAGWADTGLLRLADKSLPVPDLLQRGFDAFGTRRIMSFHLPITAQVLDRFPQAQVLMGKPMPVAAAADFLRTDPHASRITWLIDSSARLAEYRTLAEQTGLPLRIAFEVNIGLGRGGFEDPAQIAQDTGPLKPCGIMGYEAHIHALPKLLGGGAKAQACAMARLTAFAQALPADQREIINTGGSSTLMGLPQDSAANDVTTGSLLVKPSDFDQAVNAAIKPALFIVTPVLKTCLHQLPGHPRLTRLLHAARIIRPRIAFVYGGKWMAQPVHPKGLSASPFFSPSSNQHGFCLPRGAAEPGHVIFRPTQSEAVLQAFPELHLFDGAAITGSWKPFAM